MEPAAAKPAKDTRQVVEFPEALRVHELSSMRDHLRTLQQIQDAMSRSAFDEAGKLSEERLGLSSFGLHEAHQVAKYMPKGMQDIGTEMHKAASRFSIEVANSGATGDVRPALAALSRVTQQCVACHAAYRLK
jgi:hypothetical protein